MLANRFLGKEKRRLTLKVEKKWELFDPPKKTIKPIKTCVEHCWGWEDAQNPPKNKHYPRVAQ